MISRLWLSMLSPAPRSYLFVPASRPKRFATALAADADAVIIDLEDGVGPGEKSAARESVRNFLTNKTPVLLRINGPKTEWFAGDLELCNMSGVSGVVVPKAETADELKLVAESIPSELPLLPLIETAHGLATVNAIAQQPRVARLLFGSLDLQLDLGISGDTDELLYHRSRLVMASRLAGILPPVDGVLTKVKSASRLRSDSLRAYRQGFGAKLCIHPCQVKTVNDCFTPSQKEQAWAEQVVAAAKQENAAVLLVNGSMVDRPVLLRAQGILSRTVSRKRSKEHV
jgi:citrate lyase subunit beta/citryl-CoA lyase